MTYNEAQLREFDKYMEECVDPAHVDGIRQAMSAGNNQVIDAFLGGYNRGSWVVYNAVDKACSTAHKETSIRN